MPWVHDFLQLVRCDEIAVMYYKFEFIVSAQPKSAVAKSYGRMPAAQVFHVADRLG